MGIATSALLLGCAAPICTQSCYPYQYPGPAPVQWFIDAGGSITENQTADFFDNGWTVGGGISFSPYPGQPFMLRADLHYSRFDATNELLALNQAVTQAPIDNGTMQTLTGLRPKCAAGESGHHAFRLERRSGHGLRAAARAILVHRGAL
jgi:hypothetical protein